MEKGILNEKDYIKLTSETKEKPVEAHIHEHKSDKSDKYSDFFNSFKEVTKDMNPSEKGQFVDRLKEYDNKSSEHFSEPYAKYIVSKMWHKDNTGKKCIGEKYDMLRAKEVCERYKGIIPSSTTYPDVYIAINSQYHDYYCTFRKWFGEDPDYQIIDSAMMYWFKDDDWDKGCKIWEHFSKE